MRDVTGPIRNMVNTVDRIRRGQLDSRVEGFMLGELDMLKTALTRWRCRWRPITKRCSITLTATSDLRETLEQMEIQNVELDLAKSALRKRRVLSLSFWPICRTSCVRR